MLRRSNLRLRSRLRRFSTAINRRRIEDEGDWSYSSEWSEGNYTNRPFAFRHRSRHANGFVSVLSHPASKPDRSYFGKTEKWLQRRLDEVCPGSKNGENIHVYGYEWRTLHFHDIAYRSSVKVLIALTLRGPDEPCSVYLMQQPRCLPLPYVKSMITTGLTSITSCNSELVTDAVAGKQNLNVLCIGHGGGSIPLFLASQIPGAVVHTVEIDPVVVSALTRALGFPPFTVVSPTGKRVRAKPDPLDEVLWRGTHERMLLFTSDAEKFILDTSNVYDIIFIDAYDGGNLFPHKLWEPDSPFLKALGSRLHPDHGTVVVNLHADSEIESNAPILGHESILPMGKHASRVCYAYRDALLEKGDGFGYSVSVPWMYNTCFVLCRGLCRSKERRDWNMILNTHICKALEVEKLLNMPFSCLQYIQRGFTPLE